MGLLCRKGYAVHDCVCVCMCVCVCVCVWWFWVVGCCAGLDYDGEGMGWEEKEYHISSSVCRYLILFSCKITGCF
jgi:hypothetical protein